MVPNDQFESARQSQLRAVRDQKIVASYRVESVLEFFVQQQFELIELLRRAVQAELCCELLPNVLEIEATVW